MNQNESDNIFHEYYRIKYPTKDIPSFIKSEEFNEESTWRLLTKNLKFGDFFLYQTVDDKTMSYPKIGVFSTYDIADQALEYRFMSPVRTWQWNLQRKNEKYYIDSYLISEYDWTKYIYIFKVWKQMPDWKELKKTYYNTFYFRLDRQSKISRLLKS